MINYEKEIPYIVELKEEWLSENYHFSRLTTVQHRFCGYLVNNTNGHFYFELNGFHMLVIIPHQAIDKMAPSKKHFEIFQARNRRKLNGAED